MYFCILLVETVSKGLKTVQKMWLGRTGELLVDSFALILAEPAYVKTEDALAPGLSVAVLGA